MSTKKTTQRSRSRAAAAMKESTAFTDDERAAMKERARELKAAARRRPGAKEDRLEGEAEVLAKIEEMRDPDRALARRLHEIVSAAAPALSPRTWYGMP